MFGKSSPKEKSIPAPPPRSERKEQSFLQKGVLIEGTITVDGDLRVEGTLKGIINVKNVLMIGPSANAQGEIHGGEVVIHGKVTGDVVADTRIQLARGAEVTGDLYCRSLVIEEGVIFDGRSHMGETAPRVSQGDQGTTAKSVSISQRPTGGHHPDARPKDNLTGQERKSGQVFKSGRDKPGGFKPNQPMQSSDKSFQR